MLKDIGTDVKDKTVATTLVEALREIGVKYVFGVPSGGWVDYMEALRTAEGIDFILTSHEGGAAMMAEDIAALGPVKLKDVDVAQQEIVTLAREMEAEGVISLTHASSDQYV